MLTNEQLAEFVQQGDEDLKPVLWERVKSLMYMFAGRYYHRYTDYCERHGVTEWDLKQQAYTAYESSFAGYSRSRLYVLHNRQSSEGLPIKKKPPEVQALRTGGL